MLTSMVCMIGLAVEHYPHSEATEAIPRVSGKVKFTHWCGGNQEPSKQSTRPHHSWRQ